MTTVAGVAGFTHDVALLVDSALKRGWELHKEVTANGVQLKLPGAQKMVMVYKRAHGRDIKNIQSEFRRVERSISYVYEPPVKHKKEDKKMTEANVMNTTKQPIVAKSLADIGEVVSAKIVENYEKQKEAPKKELSIDDKQDLHLLIMRAYGWSFAKIGNVVGRSVGWVTARMHGLVNKTHIKPDEFTMDDFNAIAHFKSPRGPASAYGLKEHDRPGIRPAISKRADEYVVSAMEKMIASIKKTKLEAAEEVASAAPPAIPTEPKIQQTRMPMDKLHSGRTESRDPPIAQEPKAPVKEVEQKIAEMSSTTSNDSATLIVRAKSVLRRELAKTLGTKPENVEISINIKI